MRGIRPTRRGLAVVALVAGAVAMRTTFGARSLDAVIIPAVVAFVAAGAQLAVLRTPEAERMTPPADDPGSTATVSLSFSTGTPVTAVVYDRLPAGLDGEGEGGARGTTLVGGEPFTYRVTYRERGVHEVGPAVVHARDVLGLARRTFVTQGGGSVLVYPRVYHLSTPVAERLRMLSTPADAAERGAFDHLREYTRSDSLRDVHWKSSAKRDDLVVQEFVDEGDGPTVTMTASAAPGRADRMAEAAASVGYALLADGASVVLTTPAGRVTLAPGETGRLLAHLARVGDGNVAARDADVNVRAGDDGTAIGIGGETLAFDPGRRRAVGGGSDGDGGDAGTDDGAELSLDRSAGVAA